MWLQNIFLNKDDMKKIVKNMVLCMPPMPKIIISCRDKDGKDNAVVTTFISNVSMDPILVMVGIIPTRYGCSMINDTGCFVINYPKKCFKKAYGYLASVSGRDEDRLKKLNIKTEEAQYVDAVMLTDCPINIECSVTQSLIPGSHELFIAKVEAVHCDEKYLDKCGNIMWNKLSLL